jgi:glycosyltransferase involved in cell wall biosynthesis
VIIPSMPTANGAGAPASWSPHEGGKRLAVVIAMKPQLRGRIRRNVETLLEMNVRVLVLSVVSRKDFFVGLEHPDLAVEHVTTTSRYARHLARAGVARRVREAHRADAGRRRAMIWTAWRLRAHPLTAAHVLREQPSRVIGAKRITPFRPWVIAVLATVVAAVFLVLAVKRALVLRGDPHRARERSRRRVAKLRGAVRGAIRLTHPVVVWGDRARETWLRLVAASLRPTHTIETYLSFWRRSQQHAEAHAPDLLVSSDLPGLVGANRASRRLGVGHYHDCHELYLESTHITRLERRVLGPYERAHMRRASFVVAVNQSIAGEYEARYGVRPTVVRNCADAPAGGEVRDLRRLAGLGLEDRVLLYQGGFVHGRGLDVCVAALSRLPEDVHLVMLGYGPLEHQLREWATEHGVSDRLHVVSAVPPEELLSYTASATVGLVPYQPISRNNHYTLPNKIFEYTSVGLPVVASDLPELRRVVVDHGCGAVFDPYDPEAQAAALRDVLRPTWLPVHQAAARRFGAANTWQLERRIAVDGISRLLPVPAGVAGSGLAHA